MCVIGKQLPRNPAHGDWGGCSSEGSKKAQRAWTSAELTLVTTVMTGLPGVSTAMTGVPGTCNHSSTWAWDGAVLAIGISSPVSLGGATVDELLVGVCSERWDGADVRTFVTLAHGEERHTVTSARADVATSAATRIRPRCCDRATVGAPGGSDRRVACARGSRDRARSCSAERTRFSNSVRSLKVQSPFAGA